MDTHNRSYRNFLKRTVLTLCLLAIAAGFCARPASADATSFYFPRFLDGTGFDSGLAIFNPTTSDASATLTLIDATGTDFHTVSVTVPALGQTVVAASSLFGSSAVNSSLSVTSATAGLYATYSTFDTAGTYMDGTGGAQSALQLIFPVAPGISTDSMEIFLRNATTRNTAVELTIRDFAGSALGSATVLLPAGSSYRNVVGSIFPSGINYAAASHITATGRPASIVSEAQPFWGTSILSGAPPLAHLPDAAALNGLPLTETLTAGAFPYFRTGSGYYSIVRIANAESAPINVTLTAVRNDGTTAGSRTLSINSNGGSSESVESLFPALASGDQQGWILVQSNGRIAAHLLFGQQDGGSLSALALQPRPQFSMVFPQAVKNSAFNTEVSIANPGPDAGNADVYIVNPAGTTLAATRVPLKAGQRAGFRLDELFPELPDLPSGLVAVVASQPVFGTASVLANTGTMAINFAPATVPASYAPRPLSSFAVKGNVTLNGEPADGFRVILSGPVGEVTTTASDGSYEFSGLPAGKYSMKVDQFGFEFTPAVTNFEITSFNIFQTFSGFTAPGEILLLPSSIPVGSPDTTVRVFGTGFNAASVAFVDTVRLDTTFVSPTRLQIVIPAYRAEAASTFEVYVVTNGSSSKPYPVVIFLDQPQLSSASTIGDIMEGALGAVLDLQGSGFLPGAIVKINGQSDCIKVSLLSDSEILAYVPGPYEEQPPPFDCSAADYHDYLKVGGIYPVTVVNPFPSLNAESNIQLMTVYFPTPAVQGIDPTVVPVELENSTLPQLDVFGYQFRRGAVVLMDGKPLPTVYCENPPACLAEHLIAKIPAEYLRISGFAKIAVRNPVPSLAASEAVYLRIDGLQPTITSVVPGPFAILPLPWTSKPPKPVIVNGTNIGSQTLWRLWRTFTQCADPTEAASPEDGLGDPIGPTQLLIDWPSPDVGDWCVQITNPQPGGGTSNIQIFTVTAGNFVPDPFVISISPASVSAGGSSSFTLTINGLNFEDGCLVNFSSTQLKPSSVSPTQVTAQVPAYLIKNAGSRPISVTNPDNGGTSNRILIDVN